MADRAQTTAEAQLGRILYTLAIASREDEGIALSELAQRLGVSRETIRDDVAEVTAREFYHPAATVMEMTILLERDRISIPVPGQFRRPMRLTPREAGALGLALRARAAEASSPLRGELLELATALERALTGPPPKVHRSGCGEAEGPRLAQAVEVHPGEGAGEGIRLLLERAITARTPVRVSYLKPGDPAPAERVLHPYALLSKGGSWYLLAYSPEREDVREFRLDRILRAREDGAEGAFEVSESFDVSAYTARGRPYRADSEVEVLVRYSARVAPWILEYGDAEACADGSVCVRHRVADPRWLVRQVLQFAGDAVVESPAEMREAVREAAERIGRASV